MVFYHQSVIIATWVLFPLLLSSVIQGIPERYLRTGHPFYYKAILILFPSFVEYLL